MNSNRAQGSDYFILFKNGNRIAQHFMPFDMYQSVLRRTSCFQRFQYCFSGVFWIYRCIQPFIRFRFPYMLRLFTCLQDNSLLIHQDRRIGQRVHHMIQHTAPCMDFFFLSDSASFYSSSGFRLFTGIVSCFYFLHNICSILIHTFIFRPYIFYDLRISSCFFVFQKWHGICCLYSYQFLKKARLCTWI